MDVGYRSSVPSVYLHMRRAGMGLATMLSYANNSPALLAYRHGA